MRNALWYGPPELDVITVSGIDGLRPLPDKKLTHAKHHAAPWARSLFASTKRIIVCMAASQIASACAASFFWRLTKGLKYAGGTKRTS